LYFEATTWTAWDNLIAAVIVTRGLGRVCGGVVHGAEITGNYRSTAFQLSIRRVSEEKFTPIL